MEAFINALSTGPISVSALMVVVLILVGFYSFYVLPKFKANEEEIANLNNKIAMNTQLDLDLKQANIKRSETEAKLESLSKELRDANIVIKDFVENNKLNASISHSMGEVLTVVRETYQVVVQQFRSTESDLDQLTKSLNRVIDTISDMDKHIDRGHSEKFSKVDGDLRFLSQQLININQRLASIAGIIVGNPNRNLDSVFGFDERDLK